MNFKETIDQMVEQKGFAFGDPWRLTDKSFAILVPILRLAYRAGRSYCVIEEAKNQVDFVDTGRIGGVEAKSRADKPVFIRSGSAFGGDKGESTQPRSATIGTILFPMTTETLKTVCVYASKGIRTGAGFEYDGVVPQTMLYAVSMDNQGETWDRVRHFAESSEMAVRMASPRARGTASRIGRSDNLLGVMHKMEQVEGFKEKVEEFLSKIPADLDGQVGIAVLDLKGIVGLEVFDHPDSWRAFSKSIARSYSEVLMKEEDMSDVFEFKKERIIDHITNFLTSMKGAASTKVWGKKQAKTFKIESDRVIGEYTELRSEIIHLIISKKGEKRTPPRPMEFASSLMAPTPRSIATSEATNRGYSDRLKRFLQAKGSGKFLSSIGKKQPTWSDLERSVNVSTRTLSKIAKRSSELGLTTKALRENGRVSYNLTTLGKTVKKLGKVVKKKTEAED